MRRGDPRWHSGGWTWGELCLNSRRVDGVMRARETPSPRRAGVEGRLASFATYALPNCGDERRRGPFVFFVCHARAAAVNPFLLAAAPVDTEIVLQWRRRPCESTNALGDEHSELVSRYSPRERVRAKGIVLRSSALACFEAP